MGKKQDLQIQGQEQILHGLRKMQGGKKTQPPVTEQEAAERLAERRTRGREGMKLSRFAASFTPQTFEYVKLMSGFRGESMSAFIEHVLIQHKAENEELFAQLLELKNKT